MIIMIYSSRYCHLFGKNRRLKYLMSVPPSPAVCVTNLRYTHSRPCVYHQSSVNNLVKTVCVVFHFKTSIENRSLSFILENLWEQYRRYCWHCVIAVGGVNNVPEEQRCRYFWWQCGCRNEFIWNSLGIGCAMERRDKWCRCVFWLLLYNRIVMLLDIKVIINQVHKVASI